MKKKNKKKNFLLLSIFHITFAIHIAYTFRCFRMITTMTLYYFHRLEWCKKLYIWMKEWMN